jgi:hypothetical protein
MTEQMYRSLLEQLCDVAGLPDSATLRETGCLMVDGLHVTLSPATDDWLDITVGLGEVAANRGVDTYRTLLEMNAVSSKCRTGQIGIDPSSGHTIFQASTPVTPYTNGVELAHALDHVLRQAEYVRDALLSD